MGGFVNFCFVRDPVLALMEMLRDARMAAMRKPQRGVGERRDSPVRVVPAIAVRCMVRTCCKRSNGREEPEAGRAELNKSRIAYNQSSQLARWDRNTPGIFR